MIGLKKFVKRIIPKTTMNDLVLPKNTKKLLYEISTYVKNKFKLYEEWGFDKTRGKFGIIVLFVGENKATNIMAAEALANELHLNLLRIDLSTVMSKYIGETEKNLGRVFDAAEDSGSILFFDEADVLFGKRTEVRDSHDRYANIEINYLLQRMESFKGLCILSTKVKSSIDPAFLRRIRFVVDE